MVMTLCIFSASLFPNKKSTKPHFDYTFIDSEANGEIECVCVCKTSGMTKELCSILHLKKKFKKKKLFCMPILQYISFAKCVCVHGTRRVVKYVMCSFLFKAVNKSCPAMVLGLQTDVHAACGLEPLLEFTFLQQLRSVDTVL